MQPVIIWDFHIYGIVYECSYVQYIVLLTFTLNFYLKIQVSGGVSDFCSPPHTSVSHWSNLYCGCVTADIVKGSKTDLRPVRWFILNGVSVLTQERKDQITQPRRWTQVTGECDNTGKISAYISCVLLLTLPSSCYSSSSNVSGARLCQTRHHSARVMWVVARVLLRLLRWLFTCPSQEAHPQVSILVYSIHVQVEK